MFSIGVFVLVFGAAMAYVGWPLVHPLLAEDEPSVRERKRSALAEEKERLIGALRDLDHDHRTGKLDDADHATLTARLKQQAAAVLKDIDVNDGRRVLRPGDMTPEIHDKLFREGATAISPNHRQPEDRPAERKVAADSPTIRVTHAELKEAAAREAAAIAAGASTRFCTKCGREAKAGDDKFCGKCGATLPTD